MGRKAPTGPHADVAERFAFLLESLELDREGFAEAVDGAVTARSLFAILAGDRRPSRSLAVLVERTFGFRAEHLLEGTGPMWAADAGDHTPLRGLTAAEQRLVDFARRSVDNARLLEQELVRAEAWEAMWARAMGLLRDLERRARDRDVTRYPDEATLVLQECWRMADAFSAWTGAKDRRRVVHLTRLFVQRFLVQVPEELAQRGGIDPDESAVVVDHARRLLDDLDGDVETLRDEVGRAHDRMLALTEPHDRRDDGSLAGRLDLLVSRIDRLRPSPT